MHHRRSPWGNGPLCDPSVVERCELVTRKVKAGTYLLKPPDKPADILDRSIHSRSALKQRGVKNTVAHSADGCNVVREVHCQR